MHAEQEIRQLSSMLSKFASAVQLINCRDKTLPEEYDYEQQVEWDLRFLGADTHWLLTNMDNHIARIEKI